MNLPVRKINLTQIKAAKALLDWSQDDLAEKSGMSKSALAKIEAGINTPRTSTLERIITCFEDAGIEFIEDGVRKRKDKIVILEGDGAIPKLLDDIIFTLKNAANKELLIFGLDEKKFLDVCPREKLKKTIEERNIFGITQKIFLCEGDTNFIGSSKTYRWIPKQYFTSTPTYVYGEKVATLLWQTPPEIIIINNKLYASERQRSFHLIWESSIIPENAKD